MYNLVPSLPARPSGAIRRQGATLVNALAHWAGMGAGTPIAPPVVPWRRSPVAWLSLRNPIFPGYPGIELRLLVAASGTSRSMLWLVLALIVSSGGRLTWLITSTPEWAPEETNGDPDPGDLTTLKSKGSRLFSPAPAPVLLGIGQRYRPRFYPSCLPHWLEDYLLGKSKSLAFPQGTPQLYDHENFSYVGPVIPMTGATAESNSSLIVITGTPGHNCSNLVEIPISLHWCRDQDLSLTWVLGDRYRSLTKYKLVFHNG